MEADPTRIAGDRVAWLRQLIAGGAPAAPVAALVGFRLVEAERDRAVIELRSDERHANPMGTVHGGILCDIADAAMGMCFFSGLAEDESFTSLELKINFLRPVWQSLLRAEGRVLQRGRSVGLAACDVTDEQGRLVAHATSTLLVLRGEAASGR
jgi:uncharacterized protein (TIGR00369 family)